MKRTTTSIESTARLSLTSEKVRVLTASELQDIAGGVAHGCDFFSCGPATIYVITTTGIPK